MGVVRKDVGKRRWQAAADGSSPCLCQHPLAQRWTPPTRLMRLDPHFLKPEALLPTSLEPAASVLSAGGLPRLFAAVQQLAGHSLAAFGLHLPVTAPPAHAASLPPLLRPYRACARRESEARPGEGSSHPKCK